MIFFFLVFIAVCLFKCKIFRPFEFNGNYISRESTTAVNGIFVFLILIGHFVTYYSNYGEYDLPYIEVRKFLGQMVVSTFFVYSGYGIYESIKKKGTDYVLSFPKTRIPQLILHLDFAVIIFLVLFLILGYEITPLKFLLSLIGWEYIGNNNWFIFATLIFYFITFVSFGLFRKNNILSLLLVTAFTIVYIVVIKNFKPTFWYNSAICFPLGMWYSCFKEKIENFVMKNFVNYIISLAFCIGLFIGVRYYWGGFSDLFTYLSSCVFFALSIIILTMKIRFGNKILEWLGRHAFSVYMLQRIPMIILFHIGLLEIHPYISFSVTVIITLVLAELFDRFTSFTDEKFFSVKSK